MYRCLGLKSKTAVIYESLMSDYYRRLIATALGEPIKKRSLSHYFAVIEYTLGKEERDELEENYCLSKHNARDLLKRLFSGHLT